MDLERCGSLSRDRGETCPKWTQVQNQCSYTVPVTMARATYSLSALLSGDTVAKPREQKNGSLFKIVGTAKIHTVSFCSLLSLQPWAFSQLLQQEGSHEAGG